MAPKKDAQGAENHDLIANFSSKECRLLAAAFVSSIGPDKYDYDLMAKLTGNTVGSLKKMWPPVKKKAIEHHSSFATFLCQPVSSVPANGELNSATTTPSKATPGKKRKAAAAAVAADDDDLVDDDTRNDKKASAPKAKTRAKKQIKTEEVPVIKDEVASNHGNDGNDADADADAQDHESPGEM